MWLRLWLRLGHLGRGRRPFSLLLRRFRRLRSLRSRWRRRWCIDVDNFWTLAIGLFHIEGQIDLRWLRRVNRDGCRGWKGQRRRWWWNDDWMLAHLLRYRRRRRRLHRWWSRLRCRLRRLRFRRLLKHFIHQLEQIFIFLPFFYFLRILRLLLRFLLLLFLFLLFGFQSTFFANLIDSNFSASSPFSKINVLACFQIALCAFQDILEGLIVKALSQHVIDIIFICLAI